MLPRVKLYFENGNLGIVTPSPDGVLGLVVCGCAVVSTTFLLSKAYVIFSLANLTALGVTAGNNSELHKTVSEFYAEAGEGAELWIMGQADTVSMTEALDVATGVAKTLIDAAGGRLRGLVITRKPAAGYVPTITAGLDADVTTAIAKGQELAEWATNIKFAPLFVVIPGRHYSGNPVELADLHLGTNDRVMVMIGDTAANTNGATVGTLAGRIATIPVQRNIGRVKSGAIKPILAFIKDKLVEMADVASINDKGYVTLRTFIGRAGYFFTDDYMTTSATSDYAHLTARRTADKAFRIAYQTALQLLLDEIPVTSAGTLQASMVKSYQGAIEDDIANAMTAAGELSADITDVNDNGVLCFINPAQNIVATSTLAIKLRVRPFGYARYIDIYFGFATAAV